VRRESRRQKCRCGTKTRRHIFNALSEFARRGSAANGESRQEIAANAGDPTLLIGRSRLYLRVFDLKYQLVKGVLNCRRMDPMTAMAASGLRSRMESLDLVANNMANASSGGYKADREFYSLYTSAEAQDSDDPAVMPVVQQHWTDLSQGTIANTGNALDLALSGPGFFSVSSPNGKLYTRNGAFHVAAGGQLVTADGYALLSNAGNPVTAQGTLPIDISRDGTIKQDGQSIGQLEIADFTGMAVAKQGGNYFRAVDPNAKPSVPADTSVEQGKLETSNTGTAESAVRLVSIMRQFEMLQKAVLIGNDMSKQAIEQVAKVGS